MFVLSKEKQQLAVEARLLDIEQRQGAKNDVITVVASEPYTLWILKVVYDKNQGMSNWMCRNAEV
jgi:hypothetical protein